MFVKICGVRTDGDVETAVGAGADALGLVLTTSPREVEAAAAAGLRDLAKTLDPAVLTVAVVRKDPIEQVLQRAVTAGVDAVQLHGTYTTEDVARLREAGLDVIRATVVRAGSRPEELRVGLLGEQYLLLDSPEAGSGIPWDLTTLASGSPGGRWLLAGGLTPATVAAAIAAVRPWGVDVSSGVESSRGVKDHDLIRAFLAAARVEPRRDTTSCEAPARSATS